MNTKRLPGLSNPLEQSSIVAVEAQFSGDIQTIKRVGRHLQTNTIPFRPWIVVRESDTSRIKYVQHTEHLQGTAPLNARIEFDGIRSWQGAIRTIREFDIPYVSFHSIATQYMVATGQTLFRNMAFEDLVRAQVDIETLGLDPNEPDAEIIIVSASVNGSKPAIFTQSEQAGESDLINQLNQWIIRIDPDVIEGHNIFNFDLPFLATRARRYGKSLLWGRDGSAIRFTGRRRFKAGARSIPYDSAVIYGRHIVDTYQQIQRYDTTGHLSSYGLKQAIEQLGLARPDRTHVDGNHIRAVWKSDPDRLRRYALDDVLDTNVLSNLALPTEFYQCQLLPGTLQSICTGGPGEKVNTLMIRPYILAGESIPLPRESRGYPGGFVALRGTGSFGPVVNADVESLYPSIMLADNIAPAEDRLNVFLPILAILMDRRLTAKRESMRASGHEFARLQGIQSSLKVLINSFYGYLGYSRGYFNDFDAAERVTIRGHKLIQVIEKQLIGRGANIIEIDTDGIYFESPVDMQGSEASEVELIEELSASLPSGIRLAHGGRWQRMLSLKLKNYALLDFDGRLTKKGSALRSRREEPFIGKFIEDLILTYLDPAPAATARETYLRTAARIQAGDYSISEIANTETITQATFTSNSNQRLAAVARGERVGERIAVYRTISGQLARVDQHQGDEDREHLLRRLQTAANRFRSLYENQIAFDYDFPAVTEHTDLIALRAMQRVNQPKLF